jgi:hypothetical protein
MTNQSKESASKQLRNIKTPPKRWLKILDRKQKSKAAQPVSQKRASGEAVTE